MIRHPFQQNSTQTNIRISSLPNHRAHPPENRRAHPPENHRLIVNPSARPDQVQGGGGILILVNSWNAILWGFRDQSIAASTDGIWEQCAHDVCVQ
nr:hypothetical protein CFP56_57769 [Quercus suber]